MSARVPLSRGDVVLVLFPFTDLSGQKVRPALVVDRPLDEDLIAAFITSVLTSADKGAEHLLDPTDPEFGRTGLKAPSIIRLNKLATLHRSLIHRRLGRIGTRTQVAVAGALRYVFGL